MSNQFTDSELEQFNRDGFIIIPNLFTTEEVTALGDHAREDRKVQDAGTMPDSDGGESKIWITQNLEEDLYGSFSHCERIVNRLGQVFDDEVVHYHHKMMLKEPKIGGAWEWHQDYGYWYGDGFLFADMASCMVAVDKANKANGCLQVLKGSHRAGRLNHGPVGNQAGADVDRVAYLQKTLELVYVDLNPGDALFFHCNLLHRSDQNRSDNARWCLICCYYGARNYPIIDGEFKRLKEPIETWPDSKILEIASQA